jgi:hypothetical protein
MVMGEVILLNLAIPLMLMPITSFVQSIVAKAKFILGYPTAAGPKLELAMP